MNIFLRRDASEDGKGLLLSMQPAAVRRRSGHGQVEESLRLYRFGVIAVVDGQATAIGVRLKLDFQIRLTDGLQNYGTLCLSGILARYSRLTVLKIMMCLERAAIRFRRERSTLPSDAQELENDSLRNRETGRSARNRTKVGSSFWISSDAFFRASAGEA